MDYELMKVESIELTDLTDAFDSRDIGAGRETTGEMCFNDAPIVITNIRKIHKVKTAGKGVTYNNPHPIALVNTWGSSFSPSLVGTVPDDILTMMYLEENKTVVTATFEGKKRYYVPIDINRDRDAGEPTIWNWDMTLIETKWGTEPT
jgi:hypothetical protein